MFVNHRFSTTDLPSAVIHLLSYAMIRGFAILMHKDSNYGNYLAMRKME